MTAKSETVGVVAYRFRIVSPAGNRGAWVLEHGPSRHGDGTDGCVEYQNLVHESALTELRTERDELQSCFDSQQELIATLYSEQQDLISGLEALAGEWERRAKAYADDTENQGAVSGRNGYWFQGASEVSEQFASAIRRALIPAAANTESEETNHE